MCIPFATPAHARSHIPFLAREGIAMPRRALLWLGGVALVALALLLTDRLLWQPGLTEDNVRRLRPGMTLA
jgi:hypothetical protein